MSPRSQRRRPLPAQRVRDDAAPGLPPTDHSTLWSSWVQPVEVLEFTRRQRFRDSARGVLWRVLGLTRRATVVDVGCGGGMLTRTLARWLGPGCTVYGIDRDARFIEYARRRAREEGLQRRLRYFEADALALPLADGIADAVTSYTVTSHIADTHAFLAEQMRGCKPGGRVSVMEAAPGASVSTLPTDVPEPSAREQELSKPITEAFRQAIDQPWHVGQAADDPPHLVDAFRDAGFVDVRVDAFVSITTAQDVLAEVEQARRFLAAYEAWMLAGVEKGAALGGRLSAAHAAELRRCIRARFRQPRRALDNIARLRGYSACVGLVVNGRVPEQHTTHRVSAIGVAAETLPERGS
jgi:ubiquinone/menaquinone biosynthesis C-methylase UbiE